MGRDSRYVITRSNYTVKEKHKELENATIYERDYMTTTNLGGWDSGSIPYGESNFKMIVPNNDNSKKKIKKGKWLLQDGCTYSMNEDLCAVWTLSDLDSSSTPVNESKIVIKPNKNTLSDYVYYGSCTELIKSSLTKIIEKFPGEMYVTDETMSIYNTKIKQYVKPGDTVLTHPGIIDNPFKIDIINTVVTKTDDFNEFRYFATSYKKYNIIDNSGNTYCISDWIVNSKKKQCYNNGDLMSTVDLKYFNADIDSGETKTMTIYCYHTDAGVLLITDSSKYLNYRIRLTNKIIDNIFTNEFNTFEMFLLNRESTPIYSIDIDTPIETNRGIKISRQKYTWPTTHSWNLEIVSANYKEYVNSLLKVAEFYDEHGYSDNLWKNLTHDSIKNMDTTFSNPSKDENIEDYRLGISNLQSLLNVYGRQFDDIRLYIKNIKSVNSITYNDNNNIPDYLLSDTNQLSGWEISSVADGLDKNVETDVLFKGDSSTYNANDWNIRFLKTLKINSGGLLQHKGTRCGIEMLLSLFGLSSYEFGKNYYESLPNNSKSKIRKSGKALSWNQLTEGDKSKFYDYKLNEHVVVASNKTEDIVSADELLPVEYYTTLRNDYLIDHSVGGDTGVYGVPCKVVTMIGVDTSGATVEKKYMIPWFDKTENLDGSPYYQMYGGWIKDENGQYEETSQYMNYVGLISDLTKLTHDKTSNGGVYNTIVNVVTSSTIGSLYIITTDRNYQLNEGEIVYFRDKKTFTEYEGSVVNVDVINPTIIKIKCEKIEGRELSEFNILKHDTIRGNIVYVNDISDYDKYYPEYIPGVSEKPSNYFIILNINHDYQYGDDGWVNIPERDLLNGGSGYGIEVLHLMSIINYNKGNNPHTGYGKYDDGEEYLKYFKQTFYGTIKDNKFGPDAYNCDDGKINSGITKVGFTLSKNTVDNVKCWYFTDTLNTNPNKLYRINKKYIDAKDEYGDTFNVENGYEISDFELNVNVGKKAMDNKEVFFETETSAWNLETQKSDDYDEAAANSIINVKKVTLEFNKIKYGENNEFINYFHTSIMPYMKQMIPSTTIFEIINITPNEYGTCQNTATIVGVSE